MNIFIASPQQQINLYQRNNLKANRNKIYAHRNVPNSSLIL